MKTDHVPTHSRIIVVEIDGESEFLVNRFADLIMDEINTVGTFVQGTMEHYASIVDPSAAVPDFTVSNTSMGKGVKNAS